MTLGSSVKLESEYIIVYGFDIIRVMLKLSLHDHMITSVVCCSTSVASHLA